MLKIFNSKRISRLVGFGLVAAITIGSIPQLTFAEESAYTQTYEKVNALEEKLPELTALFNECDELGISTDYERINYTVIKDFIGYAREDLENGEANLEDSSTEERGEVLLERAEYVADYIETLYEQTAQKLQNYIDGTGFSLPVLQVKID